ncbi:MAG: thermonuclease family protein [Deltaproteobacteria bacterium]
MTGRIFGPVAVLAFVLAGTPLFPPASDAGAPGETGKVVRVADGDTVTIAARGGRKVNVRLYGIDAPEVRHRETPGQAYGRQARQALKALTIGRNVRVEVVDVDTHGRSVGIVFAGDLDVNLAMVRSGWAWAYRRHLSAPYASEFIDAERTARARRLGLWQDANPMPPWEFRRRTR